MGKKKKERRINVQWNQNMHILTKNGKKKRKEKENFPSVPYKVAHCVLP